jgi:hydrogenase maturation protease
VTAPGAAPAATVVIGLGNSLMGDDGIGWHLVRRMEALPEAPAGVELVAGGTDLFRLAETIRGRERVLLVDAVQDGHPPGTVEEFPVGLEPPGAESVSAHRICVLDAIRLLQAVDPVFHVTEFTVLGVSVDAVRGGTELSPPLAAALPRLADAVLEASRKRAGSI